jgi:hypothetical protein
VLSPLSALSADGGVVLLPYPVAADRLGARDWAWPAGVLDHMARVSGAEISAGAAGCAPDGVAAAVRLAAEVRQVAAAFGRGPGLHRLSDVLLEYQLTRPSPARDELAALLRPLTSRPELLETVREYVACGLDRHRAAARLQVHPNTVNYRLRKVASLTGLDASAAADLPRVSAALAALDACAAERGASASALAPAPGSTPVSGLTPGSASVSASASVSTPASASSAEVGRAPTAAPAAGGSGGAHGAGLSR